jgi:hypothetical protein
LLTQQEKYGNGVALLPRRSNRFASLPVSFFACDWAIGVDALLNQQEGKMPKPKPGFFPASHLYCIQ